MSILYPQSISLLLMIAHVVFSRTIRLYTAQEMSDILRYYLYFGEVENEK